MQYACKVISIHIQSYINSCLLQQNDKVDIIDAGFVCKTIVFTSAMHKWLRNAQTQVINHNKAI